MRRYFEYLIKDYNSNSGGKYAEYYTPHAVARIMADILVPEEVRGQIRSVDVYDPSAGSGTLLMNVAHAIGEDKCMILYAGYFAKIVQSFAVESDFE